MVTLRALTDDDLDALFVWESDPRAVQMAAFTRADPSDRGAFDAHYERVRANPANTLLAIEADGEFVGTVPASRSKENEMSPTGSHPRAGARAWRRGASGRPGIELTRPLFGRVADHNAASAKVLARAGFVEVGSDTGFAPGVGAEIVERIFRLDE